MIENTTKPPAPNQWISEGDGLRASARVTHANWVARRRVIRRSPNDQHHPLHGGTRARALAELTGLPRASMLLLGYAVEMFLKAGLAKAYRGCRSGMFDRDVTRFGHDYKRIAAAIEFPGSPQDDEHFELLHTFVTDSSRYPLMPDPCLSADHSDRFKKINEVTHTIWSRAMFVALNRLAQRVRDHAQRIDSDSRNQASFGRLVAIGKDGYLVSRKGGHLSPRIVFRYSTELIDSKRNNLMELRKEVSGNGGSIVDRFWDQAVIIEDGTKQTEVHQGLVTFAPVLRTAASPCSCNRSQKSPPAPTAS